MKDLETRGCLQLSKSFSGPTIIRGENWHFQGVIHLNILDVSFRLGLIIPDYSNPCCASAECDACYLWSKNITQVVADHCGPLDISSVI